MAKGTKAKSSRADVLVRLESFLDKISPYVVKRLTEAETNCVHYKAELELLQLRLRALLTVDQVEAAAVCGCTQEMYAIECIELWKEKIFASSTSNPFVEMPASSRSITALRY